MTKRLVVSLALAAASAFALAIATPAAACDCGDCPHKNAAHPDKKAADKAAPADKKGDAKPAAPAAPAATEKKAEAASATGTLLAAACQCEKGGKNCTCPKGECKCKNCEPAPKKAA